MQILELELAAVQDRIMKSAGTKFVFQCSPAAKDFLLEEGIDFKYGARHLKRAIERFLVYPLSNLVATDQVGLGDLVHVDFDDSRGKLTFSKRAGGALIADAQEPEGDSDKPAVKSGGAAVQLPQAKVARRGQGRGDKPEA